MPDFSSLIPCDFWCHVWKNILVIVLLLFVSSWLAWPLMWLVSTYRKAPRPPVAARSPKGSQTDAGTSFYGGDSGAA